MAKIGIGIITYNRLERLQKAVAQIRALTVAGHELLVADDGSMDGTADWCRANGVRVIGGENRGVCWNKNRALYALLALGCDPILLLEDDARPADRGWEESWREATALWGHVSYAHPKITNDGVPGSGTPQDPYVSVKATGQCASISADGLARLGYLDTRFKGYGVGHAEWTGRAKRLGMGFKMARREDGTDTKANLYITGGLMADDAPSFRDGYTVARNRALSSVIKNEPLFRPPWSSAEERVLFEAEQRQAGIPLLPQSADWPDEPLTGDTWQGQMLAILQDRPPPKKRVDKRGIEEMQKMRWDIEHRLKTYEMKMFLDVGAHQGITTLAVRDVFPEAVVHAFEPAPESFRLLSDACAADSNIHCRQVALGSAAAAVRMQIQGSDAKNHIAPDGDTEVAMLRGDDYLQTAAIPRVNYLRIDTAGHDLDVLKGFQHAFASTAIDLVELAVGLHPAAGRLARFKDVGKCMEAAGYILFSLQHGYFETRPYLRRCTATYVSPRLVRENTPPRK